MKKIAIASLIALATMSASAMELGVTAARDFAGDNRNAYGITLGQKFGAVGVTAGFDRATSGVNDQDRYSLVGSYDVAKVGSATVAVKAGAAYLSTQGAEDGYAALVGVGVSYPLTKAVSVGVDLTSQYGQKRVEQFNGNRVTAGLKFAF